jgi:23S rRNA (guanosine2251-2'-O)-methyltransferase
MDRIAGRIPVLECLRAGKRKGRRLFVLQGAKDLESVIEAAKGIPVEELSRADLNKIVPETINQGVILQADPLPVAHADAWVKQSHPADSVVVILDGIEDPHNFGAIIRSASAFGARAVMYSKDRSAPISPVTMKTAAGAVEHIELVQAANLARVMKLMKEEGYWLAGLDERAQQTLWETDLTGRIALVIGSEGKGMRRLTREMCDYQLRIPVPGPIKSLNASVSAALVLGECLRQRMGK